MSIFCGFFYKNSNHVDRKLCDELIAIFSVCDNLNVFEGPGLFVIYSKLGVWDQETVLSCKDNLICYAGDPVIIQDGKPLSRKDNIYYIKDFFCNAPDRFTQCEGSYCALNVDLVKREIKLVNDKIGVRPVYFASDDQISFFSNALWPLESLSEFRKTPNIQAISETIAFGYPLADRTLYKEISLLSSGSMLRFTNDGLEKISYWNWMEKINSNSISLSASELEDVFLQAIRDRIDDHKLVTAFLSGGMDSRWIVKGLRQSGVDVDTINFAPSRTRDLLFGKLAAKALNTFHFEYAGNQEDFSARVVNSIDSLNALREISKRPIPENNRIIWSGDGGSVGVGHVYLNDELIEMAKNEYSCRLVDEICNFNKFYCSPNLFAKKMRYISDLPKSGLFEELQRFSMIDPGRACHLFFIFNDQRRHLVNHFENIHKTKIDFILPFFDSRLLNKIFNSKIDDFIFHRLYSKVFENFPEPLSLVPWQTYPGHVSCPIKFSGNFRDQWQDGWYSSRVNKSYRISLSKKVIKRVFDGAFNNGILSKFNLLIAAFITMSGLKDYSYLLNQAILVDRLYIQLSRKG